MPVPSTSLVSFVASRFDDHFRAFAWMIMLILFFAILERAFPVERGQTIHGRLRNIGFIAVFQLGGGILLSIAAYLIVPHLLLSNMPVPHRSAIERAGVILLYIFLGDLIFYWYHRAQHSTPSLWVLHELHHSDSELNVTSSLRTYLLERPIQFLVISLPLTFFISTVSAFEGIRLAADETGTLYFCSLAWLFFAHANLRLQLGRLSWIGTGPQVHRIHHSIEASHQQKNFAQFFPILDIAFGTYCAPRRGEFPKTGTEGLPAQSPLAEVLLRPMRHWWHYRA